MSEQFTPGPWEIYAQPIESGQQAKDEFAFQVDSTTPIGPVLYLINADGKCPAITGCGPTSEANAHLIAAAPELYAACQAALESMEAAGVVMEGDVHAGDPAIEQLQAALAKASPDNVGVER